MTIHDWDGWPRGPLHLTFGVFDGVHRGHRLLVETLVHSARAAGARAVVGTFDVHPARVVAPRSAPLALSSADEKRDLLLAAGADTVVLWTFDRAFSRISAEDFLERVLAAGEVRHVLAGPDLVFGHERTGDVALLRALGARRGFIVAEAAPLLYEEAPISSTRIRAALAGGDVARANAMLGREYGVRGTVIHGAGRGRGLGFPTLNLATPSDRQLPRDGIYALRVVVGDRVRGAAGSLGVRPTFERAGPRLLEAHLLDADEDLYGAQVEVRFVARIRDETAFPSAEALAAQISEDIAAVRAALRR